MEWTIRAAQQLPLDGVFVSTDGQEIADHARELGATIIERPIDLAGDNTKTEDVLVHAIKLIYGNDIQRFSSDIMKVRSINEIVSVMEVGIGILMECTQPLKDITALKTAMQRMRGDPANENIDSMFLAYECPLFVWNEHCQSLTYDYERRALTQTMRRYFLECGDYLFHIDKFMAARNRINGNIGIQPCNRFAQLDIDDPEDLRFVDAIAREFNLKPAGL